MKIINYLKLIYLYFNYFFVGMEEGGFQYQKALYLIELESYFSAIKALKKAEKDIKTSYVWAVLGWCYVNIEQFDKSLHYYKLAFKTDKTAPILCGLAMSEAHAGSIDSSKSYLELLKPYHREDPTLDEYVKNIEKVLLEKTCS